MTKTVMPTNEEIIERFLEDSEVIDELKWWAKRTLEYGRSREGTDPQLADRLEYFLDFHATTPFEIEEEDFREDYWKNGGGAA